MTGKRPPSGAVDWFVAVVFAAGAAAFTLSFYVEPLRDWPSLALVVVLTALSEAFAVRLTHDGRVSFGTVAIVLAVLIFGAPGAALVSATIALTSWLRYSRKEVRKLAFNFGSHNVASLIAALLLLSVGPAWSLDRPLLEMTTGIVVGVLIFGLTSAAVATVVALSSGERPVAVYRRDFAPLVPHYGALGALGGGLAVAYDALGIAGVATLSIPLVLSRYSMKQVVDATRENVFRLERSNQQLQGAYLEIRSMSDELTRAYTGTLESLVAALDVRDQETRGHSVRVATHSLDIARLLGIGDEQELATIYRGALMHDVGKIGVPDAVLLKPAKLTEDEWELMRKHPGMGYRILAQVPYLRPTARIVLAHHERWDGAGYPRRLRGEDIPLGARIFAICDTYDAIISDRPYRQGQSPDAALAEILRCAGSQFDPEVVEAFEAAFPRWREEAVGRNVRPLYLPAWRRPESGAGDRAAS